MLEPEYINENGITGTDPLALLSQPVVDLHALACWFSAPALFGEFVPRSPWKGLQRLRRQPYPMPMHQPLRDLFRVTIENLIHDVDTVAVRVSGGLDSLAVLVHTLKLSSDRRVIALTVDLLDDSGCSSVATTQRLLTDLKLDCELLVIDPSRHHGAPTWSPHGPSLAAMPWLDGALADTAERAGADLLLSGDGADELLCAPPFATTIISLTHGLRAGLSYLRDACGRKLGLAGEWLSAMGTLMPARFSLELYWAFHCGDLCSDHTASVLTPSMREAAANWAREFILSSINDHVISGRNWVEAAAYDAIWPHDLISPAGTLHEASPFLTEPFFTTALSLPIAGRHNLNQSTRYHRCKAQVVQLFEPHMVPFLPRYKQYYAHAFADMCPTGTSADRCIEVGLIDPDQLRRCIDPAVLLMVAAMEDWLAGADAAGALIPGLSATRSAIDDRRT